MASDCPDFFRFVDFGMVQADGTVTRGGTILRGESFEGESLLLDGASVCRDVRDVARDGRGNPIPVVKTVAYDPTKTGLDVASLAVTDAGDSFAAAEENAAVHRARLERPGTSVSRGSESLCAGDSATLSCQVVSPYPGDAPVVVYCGGGACRLPVLAIDGRLSVSGRWPFSAGMSGDDLATTVREIHGFLDPLTSLSRN